MSNNSKSNKKPNTQKDSSKRKRVRKVTPDYISHCIIKYADSD